MLSVAIFEFHLSMIFYFLAKPFSIRNGCFLYWQFLFFNFNQRELSQPSEHTFYRAAFDLICFCFHICDAMCARQILNLLELVTLTSTRNYLLFAMGHIFCQDFLFVSILILKVSLPLHLLLLLCLWNCLKTLLHWKVSSRWHAYIFIYSRFYFLATGTILPMFRFRDPSPSM